MRRQAAAMILLPTALALSACAPEPFDRPGTWRATGINDANLRAMIADPADLERGRQPLFPSRGEAAALAAARLAHGSTHSESRGGGGAGGEGGGQGQQGVPALPPPQNSNVRR